MKAPHHPLPPAHPAVHGGHLRGRRWLVVLTALVFLGLQLQLPAHALKHVWEENQDASTWSVPAGEHGSHDCELCHAAQPAPLAAALTATEHGQPAMAATSVFLSLPAAPARAYRSRAPPAL